MKTPQARALGFRHDGSAAALIRHSLKPAAPPRRKRGRVALGVTEHAID
jgi:hypothetical protein